MMFKDDIKTDLDIFVDVTEFGELIDINGVICKAQLMSHTAQKSARLTETFDKLHGDFSELYFITGPYVKKKKKVPKQGDWLWVNGRRYDVVYVENELGITHITLSAYRQGVNRR